MRCPLCPAILEIPGEQVEVTSLGSAEAELIVISITNTESRQALVGHIGQSHEDVYDSVLAPGNDGAQPPDAPEEPS